VQDDLLLREAVECGASLKALALGAVRLRSCPPPRTLLTGLPQVTFSQPFSEEQLAGRWRALLFDPAVGVPAAQRMQGVPRRPQPPPAPCDDLKTLLGNWRAARRAAAAAGGPCVARGDGEDPTFSEVRPALPEPLRPGPAELAPQVEEVLLELGPRSLELGPSWSAPGARVGSRCARRADRAQLLALERGARAASDRGMGAALAVLRGAHARFMLSKPEVLLGRSTEDQKVDCDLALEGNASKVSRQHAFLSLRADGHFYVRNVGRRALLVNNAPVETGQRAMLPPDCLLEIGGLRLLFMQNRRKPTTAVPGAAHPAAVAPAQPAKAEAAAPAPAVVEEDRSAAAFAPAPELAAVVE